MTHAAQRSVAAVGYAGTLRRGPRLYLASTATRTHGPQLNFRVRQQHPLKLREVPDNVPAVPLFAGRLMANIALTDYLAYLGFTDGQNPFGSVNARDERAVLEGYFVPPPYFETLWGDPGDPKSAIVLAPTGAGKTALAVMLDERAASREPLADGRLPVLTVLYDEYARLGLSDKKHDLDDHLSAVNYLLTISLLKSINDAPFPSMAVSSEERALLRYAFARYVGGKSSAEVYRDIEQLKTPWEEVQAKAKRIVNALPVVSLVAKVLQYSADKLQAGTEFVKALGEMKADTRDFTAPPETDFLRLVELLGHYYQAVYVLVDRVDETHWTQRDATATYNLVHPLVANLNLLDRPERQYAFKFFLWDGIAALYKANAREDRVFARTLVWKREQLIAMLEGRVRAFSSDRLSTFDVIFDHGVSAFGGMTPKDVIVLFAGTSPRAVVTLCKYLIEEQVNLLNQEGADARRVGRDALVAAIDKYAREVAQRAIPEPKAYREITSLGRVVFSSKMLVNEIFRGNKPESVQSKVGKWKQRFDVFQTIGNEASGKRGFPTEVHAITDVCVAYLAAALPLETFLGAKVRRCDACDTLMLRDFDKGGTFRCTHCSRSFELPRAIVENEQVRQDATRRLARELAKHVSASSDIQVLCRTASLEFGEDTFAGTPFLIWARILQFLISNDEEGLRSLLEVVDDSLPPDSEAKKNALVELYASLDS
ncbi:hypothetical protein tb265_41400 [Gemmatimonadetes bacterium T265]|nr:hypothetical protein tb265_41400 [Gemmatimonadetes bacterium T265]